MAPRRLYHGVFVEGAAGGVGSLTVQLAKLYGAGTVIGGASSAEKRNFALKQGADATVAYREPGRTARVLECTAGRGVDFAFNGPAATLPVAPLAEALKASVPVVALVQDHRGRSTIGMRSKNSTISCCSRAARNGFFESTRRRVLEESAGLAVATTNMGKGSVDERHPLSLGVAGNAMGRNGSTRHLKPLIDRADVILLIGTRTNQNGTDSRTLYPR